MINRKQFLALFAAQAAPFQSERRVTEYTGLVEAPPEAIFPLLCPVREYEWLYGWKCRMIYSRSGVAEDNCIFETEHGGATFTWSLSRFEPPRTVEYTVIAAGLLATRLHITLTPDGRATRILWRRVFTGLSPEGNLETLRWQTARDARLTAALNHFLKTGAMLQQPF